MTDTIKKEVINAIDKHISSIIDVAKDIGGYPELGYKEFRTSGIVNNFLQQAGYTTEQNLALTGIKAKLNENSGKNPTIAIIGELDGITCPASPKADMKTGATHNCGHNLGLGILMAVAQAFKVTGIAAELGGNIAFIAVPAEEYIDLEYRSELKRRKEIRYFGGKQELVHCGAFDDINAAMMVHSQGNTTHPYVGLVGTGNGFIARKITYTGKAAHAAAAPEEGINALHAAISGINNVNALRETFRDECHDRIHYIITKGGDTVNSIPADVRLECFVRSNSINSIRKLLEKSSKAFISGGDALGARTDIELLSGYLPLACNGRMNAVYAENAKRFIPENRIESIGHFTASTDMGDISQLMPAIHPMAGGINGALHAPDFEVVDYRAAIEIPAKTLALTLIDLLAGDAKNIKSIIESNTPLLTKQEYLALLDSFFRSYKTEQYN